VAKFSSNSYTCCEEFSSNDFGSLGVDIFTAVKLIEIKSKKNKTKSQSCVKVSKSISIHVYLDTCSV
jgi:hypothetical protein